MELWPAAGSPLLFYPGSMLEPGHYRLFLNALAEAGFSVCGLHLPGHGQNSGRLRAIDELLEFGLEAERWVAERYQSQVALCGHSQGGILAMAHAARSELRGPCFSICSVFPDMPSAIELTRFAPFVRHRHKIMAFIAALARVLPRLPVPLPLYLSLGRLLRGRKWPLAYGNGEGPSCYPLQFVHSLFDARIARPLRRHFWLFSAENDALFTKTLTKETFAQANPPGGKIIWLPDGGHLALFNPALAAFVASSCASFAAGLGLGLKTGQIP